MKEIKSSKKTNVLKKLFIKICRLSGFELIDQSNLEFPTSKIRDKSQFSEPGKKSVSLGSGKTVITRKVEGIDIIFKTCTSVQLVSQNKKRIFEKQKNEYTNKIIIPSKQTKLKRNRMKKKQNETAK